MSRLRLSQFFDIYPRNKIRPCGPSFIFMVHPSERSCNYAKGRFDE